VRLALNTSIIASRKSQRQIDAETNIHPNRLSELVQGWADPRADERAALMRVLGCSSLAFEKDATLEIRSARQ
jgi:hypothetical protein